jgi:hypothetical protein
MASVPQVTVLAQRLVGFISSNFSGILLEALSWGNAAFHYHTTSQWFSSLASTRVSLETTRVVFGCKKMRSCGRRNLFVAFSSINTKISPAMESSIVFFP